MHKVTAMLLLYLRPFVPVNVNCNVEGDKGTVVAQVVLVIDQEIGGQAPIHPAPGALHCLHSNPNPQGCDT